MIIIQHIKIDSHIMFFTIYGMLPLRIWGDIHLLIQIFALHHASDDELKLHYFLCIIGALKLRLIQLVAIGKKGLIKCD